MSFLAPFFFLGALAVGLPILFHLIRRTVKERKTFSSLMFLLPSPPRLTRRSRLEHLLLLLLRCTVIALLATAFARPFLQHSFPPPASDQTRKRVLVLLDGSASMQRQKLWDQARQKAEAIVRQARPEDEMALFTFDRRLTPLVTFDEWKATAPGERWGMVHNRLTESTPGWLGTSLDQALIEAGEFITENGKDEFNGPRQIVLLSDLQEGSRISALQGHEWPKGIEVLAQPLKPSSTGNAGLQLVTETDTAAVALQPSTRLRVSNASDSKREQYHVAWALGGVPIGKPVGVYVPPGQSRVVLLPPPPSTNQAEQILLQGDEETFDNRVFVLPPEKIQRTILYLGSDSAEQTQQPLFFLEHGFQSTGRETMRIIASNGSGPLPPGELNSAALLVYTSGPLGDRAAQLHQALESGKTLLFAPVNLEAASHLGEILGGAPIPVHEDPLGRYAMLGEMDFRHPLFAPFADARYSDFTKIHFWKYRRFDLDGFKEAHIIARFDSGDPAIFEIPAGKGRVMVMASGWQPADSQLALSSKFVPLLYSLLDLSGAAPPPPAQYFVGDTIPVPAAASPTEIRMPDGSITEVPAGETNFSRTLMPGVYQVVSVQPPRLFAVNLDPAESRTAPLGNDELERLGVPGERLTPVTTLNPQLRVRLQNAELEGHQKLWRWFIVAAFAILALESCLAGWTARHLTLKEENS